MEKKKRSFLSIFYNHFSDLFNSLIKCYENDACSQSSKFSFEIEDVIREVKKARLKASKDLVQILRKQFGLDEYFE